MDSRLAAEPTRNTQLAAPALTALLLLFSACATQELPKNGERVAECCESLGGCLPEAWLPENERVLLGSDGCAQEQLCVPYELRGVDAPPSCTASATGSEGRCMPACLPAVQAALGLLRVDGCEEHQRCVPCYDPITGATTHACEHGEDLGPQEPPKTFEDCCEDRGRCVPGAALSSQQRDVLGMDTCGSELLCVPLENLEQPADSPAPCKVELLGVAGGCLSECIPAVAENAELLTRASCSTGQLCVPCIDPQSGEPTGACSSDAAEKGP